MMELFSDREADRFELEPQPLQHHVGDLVVFMGRAYIIAAIIDLAQPLYLDWPTGLYFALRCYDWPQALNLLVPALAVEQPHLFAA